MARASNRIPWSALTLGLAGLIPFISAAALSLISPGDFSREAIHALAAYGAVILSFLGGVRWGHLLTRLNRTPSWGPLALSTVPSLIAWPALLLPTLPMLLVLSAGLLLQYWLDRRAVTATSLPAWYGRLRLILTIGAILSLLTGAVALFL